MPSSLRLFHFPRVTPDLRTRLPFGSIFFPEAVLISYASYTPFKQFLRRVVHCLRAVHDPIHAIPALLHYLLQIYISDPQNFLTAFTVYIFCLFILSCFSRAQSTSPAKTTNLLSFQSRRTRHTIILSLKSNYINIYIHHVAILSHQPSSIHLSFSFEP